MKSSHLVPYLILPLLSAILLIPTGSSCSCGSNNGNPVTTTTQANTTEPAAHIPPITTPSPVPMNTQITSTTPTAVVITSTLPPIATPPPISTTIIVTAPTATATVPTATAPVATTTNPPTTSYALPPPPTAISIGADTAPGPNLTSLTPTLKWTTVTETDGYALYIFKAPFSASDLVYIPQITGNSATVPAGILTTGLQYKWAVVSHGPGGWSFLSNFLFFTT